MPPKRTTKKILPISEILKELDDAMIKEELALPVYASHIQAVLFWSGLPSKKQEKIHASLEILLRESAGHVGLLKYIKKLYQKELRTKRTITK